MKKSEDCISNACCVSFVFRRLQAQLQQQPFKPVFPTPAATASSVSHVPNIVSVIANTSSQSRRRSGPNQPMFCPHVTSSSQSQSAYAMPSFRSSSSAQSHFLNPPNPAQNPYQSKLILFFLSIFLCRVAKIAIFKQYGKNTISSKFSSHSV